MKILTHLFALVISIVFTTPAMSHPPATTFEAMVVLHIKDLDDPAIAKLAHVVGGEKNTSLEYSCVWSGVVILKFTNASIGERADLITMAYRVLSDAGIDKGVEVLHVHAEERGPGKC